MNPKEAEIGGLNMDNQDGQDKRRHRGMMVEEDGHGAILGRFPSK